MDELTVREMLEFYRSVSFLTCLGLDSFRSYPRHPFPTHTPTYTRSLDEAEVLCDRIAVMVGGRLRCLGTSQHLKTKYGRG